MTCQDGNRYLGQWKKDVQNGKGTLIFQWVQEESDITKQRAFLRICKRKTSQGDLRDKD